MVFLHNQVPSRKRLSNAFVSPLSNPSKIPKSSSTTTATAKGGTTTHRSGGNGVAAPENVEETLNPIDRMVSVLADAGCTLINPSGPPCLPADLHKLRHHLHGIFSSDSSLRSQFLSAFSSYIESSHDFRRVLLPSHHDGCGSGSGRNESLVRILLLVPSIQLDLQKMLLEKLPDYFDTDAGGGFGQSSSLRLDEDIARLILNQFRWLDFLVAPEAFTENLFHVLSICPPQLKKEIIGSLPEVIGDNNSKTVVDALEKVLQDDSTATVAVIDCFSNLNLDDQSQEKVITIALSCIRTIEAEKLPYLLRFLLLSATPTNARRIISQLREQYKLVGVFDTRSTQHSKLKGKSVVTNVDASVLEALGSSLRFKNILCEEILKELKCLEKAQDHKVIDIWLLMLIYKNSESMQKSVEKVFKKKILEGCIQEVMFEQCIFGNKELVQDHFPSFLSLSEYLLACKEHKAREFGIHMYIYLFEGFSDTYSRQEVLGALVTHVGSGITFEVSSALEVMVVLASRYSQELVPLSCHISGLLDYLEGFNVENLHKVYEVFCFLALSVQSNAEPFGSSIANELLMIVRKQVNSPEFKYKKMGVIGTLKIVFHLGSANNTSHSSSSQKLNHEEALELLKTSLDSCQQLPTSLILFYDELSVMLDCRTPHPAIMERIGKDVGDFESTFLSDLENGKLPVCDSYCGLEGELWVNLDGDISPICMNILPLVSSSSRPSSSLQILPANFRLLSVIEMSGNHGSLGGIDALLGCPLHLPSSKFFLESAWQSLSRKQKHVVCLSLYYAINWIRELLNAFCTQIAGRFDCISQGIKEETIAKMLKRLRNLVYLESLLNISLKQSPLSLPELYPHVEPSSSFFLSQPNRIVHVERNSDHMKANQNSSQNSKRKDKKTSKASQISGTHEKTRQPTILDVLNKAGAIPSQDVSNEGMSANSSASGSQNSKRKDKKTSKASKNSGTHEKTRQPTILDVLNKAGAVPSQDVSNEGMPANSSASESAGQSANNSTGPVDVEVSAAFTLLEAQRYKFRPLSIDCFSILTFPKVLVYLGDTCMNCIIKNVDSIVERLVKDPAAELPLYLYLLRDLHSKLGYLIPKQTSAICLNTPAGFSGITMIEFLSKIRSLFPTIKGHLDCAVSVLEHGSETCEAHWKVQSAMAGNPDITNMVVSISLVSSSVVKETLYCFCKMLNFPDIQMEKSVLSDLLKAFQPKKVPDCIFAGMNPIPSSGHVDYLYCGAYSFFEGVFSVASSFSFMLASEVLLTLESLIISAQKFLDKSLEQISKHTQAGVIHGLLPTLRSRLGASTQKLLRHKSDIDILENGWKGKGEMVQKMVHLYLENCESTSSLLDELACSILPEVSFSSRTTVEEDGHGFTALCPATFVIWYKELHEENLTILNKLVKEAVCLEKTRANSQLEAIQILLNKLQQSVNVVVSLINMCRTHDKVSVRAMAVKYGGKFIDSFLKVFDFLQANFQMHNELIIQLVKELQKGTRTIQTLCSEAKGLKQTVITSKIPATKRSLERFLFRVKALLHTSSSGCTFWMGNLKHKNLMGQVVSSQAYVDNPSEHSDEDLAGPVLEDQLTRAATDEDRETE